MINGFGLGPPARKPLGAQQADMTAPVDLYGDLRRCVPRFAPSFADALSARGAVRYRTLIHELGPSPYAVTHHERSEQVTTLR